MAIIHFNNVRLCESSRHFYHYSKSRSLCGSFSPNIISPDWKKTTCLICKKHMSCDHNWILKYQGRHGSDKGDDYFECINCNWLIQVKTNWTPQTETSYIEKKWNKLSVDYKKS